MNWDSYRSSEYRGIQYGMKSASFQDYLDLPQSTGPIFTLAVGSPSTPRALLESKGWTVIDPRGPTLDPWTYQQFIQASKAEFSIAKQGYVRSWSGWFSERSAAYLASGRPVVAQDTGFSHWLEIGSGLLSFRTIEEAKQGIEAVSSRYDEHCQAARAIAEAHFDARRILPRLVERAMLGQGPAGRQPCSRPSPEQEGLDQGNATACAAFERARSCPS
jgi:hypothetical protein